MHKNLHTLPLGKSKYYGLEDQGIWALLLVVTVIQVACAFGASRDVVGDGKTHVAAAVQLNHGTLLARK